MKKMSKIMSLLLALVMILGLATTAMAATITVNDSKSGHIYEAYQIFTGTDIHAGKLTNPAWGTGIDGAGFLAALKADTEQIWNADHSDFITFATSFASATDAEDVAEVIQDWGSNGTRLKRFARLASDYITSTVSATTDRGTIGSIDAADVAPYELSGLPIGYYLIKDKAYDAATPPLYDDFYTDIILMLGTDGAVIDVKGDVPTLEKKVSLDPATGYGEGVAQEIGKYVYYKLIAHLPSEYDEYSNYYYEFVDVMDKGLTFEGIESLTLNYKDPAATDLTWDKIALDASAYKYDAFSTNTDSGTGKTTVRMAWNNIKSTFADMGVGDTLELVLKAKVNEHAIVGVDGTTNEAYLVYSNDPNGTGHGTSVPDEAIVYTFNIDIIKTVEGGSGETLSTLANAKFVLLHKHGSDEVYAQLDSNNKLAKWVEHYEGDGCPAGTHTASTEMATLLISETGKVMAVDGLTSGLNYYLREVEAPVGYNKLFSDITLELKATIDSTGALTNFEYEADGVTVNPEEGVGDPINTNVLLEVENKQGATLPHTGGIGTTIFYILGGLMATGAAVVLITKKRMGA